MSSLWQILHQKKPRSRHLAVFLILVGTTLAVSTIALISYEIVRELILGHLREKALLEVKQGINDIDQWLATRKAEVETIAHSPIVQSMNWERARPYLKSEVERLQEYSHITYVNSDGSYFTTKVGFAPGQNILDRVWFQKSLAGKVYVSDPLISRTTGIVQIIISAPIINNAQPKMVLGGAIKINRVVEVVNQLKQGKGSYAFALNSEGRIIVHPDPKLRGTLEKPASSFIEAKDSALQAIARNMVNKKEGIDLAQIDGIWQYVAYAPLDEADWSIALVIPRENLESQLNSLNFLATILGILIAIALVGTWRQIQLFEKTQTQVQLLSQQAEELNQTLASLKQTQVQLVQSEKMSSLGLIVAGLAHEINNPVSFIYGNLPYVREYVEKLMQLVNLYRDNFAGLNSEITTFETEIELEYIANDLPLMLNSINIGSERISQMILSLRNFSRLDEAEYKKANLHEGLDNALLFLQHKLKDRIQVIKNYGDLPLIECYHSQLNQVFMSILSNAIDALEAGDKPDKKITITTQIVSKLNDWVRIAIADNGVGISEEIKSKIFDPFFTTKPIGKGTGLGLAISYQIVVKVHQGQILIQTPPQGGVEFIIEFPIYLSSDQSFGSGEFLAPKNLDLEQMSKNSSHLKSTLNWNMISKNV